MIEISAKYWIYALGFFSQFLFGVRLLIQWVMSEREGKVVSPIIFWQLSLIACYLFLVYGILQNDFVIILGQGICYIICIRNLQLEGAWAPMSLAFRVISIVLPILTVIWMFSGPFSLTANLQSQDLLHPIVLTGATGRMLLNIRFLYQWYYAEKMKTASLPLGFWWMTIIGSVMTLVYAIVRVDPVLLFAQGLGLIAALRNTQLYYKEKAAEKVS